VIALEVRTVFTSSIILTTLCVFVTISLWARNRKRSPEIILWLINAIMQDVALVLFALRGVIPDFVSIIVANGLVIGGTMLLYVGLERYVGRRSRQWANGVFLIVFLCVHAYFTYVHPNLAVRTVNASAAIVLITAECAWLLLHRTPREMRTVTLDPGLVFLALILVNAAKIPFDIAITGQDMLNAGPADALGLVLTHMLFVALTFSLLLMVNRRLVIELEQDIVERERAQEALRLSEQKFSMAFENIPDAIVVTVADTGRIIEVNQGFVRTSGYTKEEAIGETTIDLGLWADPVNRDEMLAAVRRDGRVTDFTAKFRGRSGQVFDAVVSSESIVIDDEPCILTMIRDETERIRAQSALALSEMKFATAFRTSPDSVNINRVSDGAYIDVNEGFTKLTGYRPEDVAGKTSRDIEIWVDPADRDRLVAGLLADGVVHNLEARFRRKDGSTTTALMSAQLIDVEGERCILSVTRDISDRKRAEDEILRLNAELEERVEQRTQELQNALEDVSRTNEVLTEMNERLEQATSAKSDFLAAMSHELRTPLNSIIGFSDLLARGMVGDLSPEQVKQIRMINSSGKYLLELVNEVLDLSAIEVGQLRIEVRPLSATHLARAVVDSLQPLAVERGLELSWDVALDADALESDRTRLEQILFNLLGNAIKFTDAGTVSLNVTRDGDDILFSISDTGRGIADDELDRVFEEFYQSSRLDVAKSEGTGLGLTVSRRLAQMLGGSIEAESVVGQGSTFTVRIPVR
jgi:PAS domain S-box-containing protein